LHMPHYRHPRRFQQANRVRLSLAVPPDSREYPIAVAEPLEVFRLDPLPGLLVMSSPTPSPQHAKDPLIDIAEGAFTAGMAGVPRPSLDPGVPPRAPSPRRAVASLLLDYFPNPGQERLDALLRRLESHLAVWEASHRLTQEIKAVFATRDPGFL